MGSQPKSLEKLKLMLLLIFFHSGSVDGSGAWFGFLSVDGDRRVH